MSKKKSPAKRNEILDFALELIYSKGYERLTIQDGLRISRGALYHYFDSKQYLLSALVDRMVARAVEAVSSIIQNPSVRHTARLVFEPIIRQGIEEHLFTTRFPEQGAQICASAS